MSEESGMGTGTVLLSFLAGAAVGVGAALLLAPKTGEELRGQIKDLTEDAVDKIKDFTEEAQSKIRTSYEEGRDKIMEKKGVVASAIEAGKEAMERERERQKAL